jgi:Leucine-rich repeat (LRR) protein
MSKPGFKKNFEYLFITLDPRNKNEFYHLVEEGYCSTTESLGQGKVPYEGLHNTLLGSDLFRINYYREQHRTRDHNYHSKLKLENKVPTGFLLLCKVVLMNLKADQTFPTFDLNKGSMEIFRDSPISPTTKENADVLVTYRDSSQKSGKLDHKLYFIHDNNLILPEYLVEFDYEYSSMNRSVCHIGETMLALNNPDLAFFNPADDKQPDQKIDLAFKSRIEEIQLKYADPKYKSRLHLLLDSDLQSIQFFSLEEFYKSGMEHLKIPILNYLIYFENSVVEMEAYKGKLAVLEQYKKEHHEVFSITSEKDAACVEYLSMRLHSLSSFPMQYKFDKIRELDVSCNKLTSLSFVSLMPMLEVLLAPDNLVETIDPSVTQASHLKKLDLCFNKIKDINQLKQLKACPALLYLSVKGNPFCHMFPKYQEVVITLVAGLAELDEQSIAVLRKTSSFQKPCQLTEKLIKEVISHPDSTNPAAVVCRMMNITAISLTIPLADIRIVDLSNNGLTKLDGIQFLRNLAELNAENNQIFDITDVGHLSELRKLELGSNLITNVGHCLTGLKNLTLLSIENNKLTSLSCFSELENLLEIYVGENLIDDLKEIRHLSNLKKLLVMDLWGNPLCKDKEFRLFCIFHIKDLKVLDGYPIQPKEIEDSKQAYTGKLSDELLAERLQGKNMDTLLNMDLSFCSLRDFDNIFNNKKFPRIVEINVTGNFFTTLKCIGYLPTLKVLNMTDNRLTSFEPVADPKMKIGLNGLPVA